VSKPKPFLNYHYNENDAIKGERIVIEAKNITKPVVISDRTARHGGQRAKADDAEAWIERAYVLGKRKL
jgi:hypothetical protein